MTVSERIRCCSRSLQVTPADLDSLPDRHARIARQHPAWQGWEAWARALSEIGIEVVASAPRGDRPGRRPKLRLVHDSGRHDADPSSR